MGTPVYAVKGIVGPPGPIAASVASPSTLGTLDAAGRWPTGTVAYEQTAKSYWTLDRTSTATPDGVKVVAAATTGRWLLWSTQWSSATVPAPASPAEGDSLIYDAGTWTRLPVGSAGQALGVAAGKPAWVPQGFTSLTVAGLSTIPDAPLNDGQRALVTASTTRAYWVLSKASTLTADAVTVVATQSGTGRWILESRARGGPVPVTEVGADPTGSVDSSGAFQAACNALAGTGVSPHAPGGSFAIKPVASTGIGLSSNLGVLAGAASSFVAAVPAGDGHTDSPFYTTWSSNRQTSVTTLAANVVEGAKVAQVGSIASLPVGTYVIFDAGGGDPEVSFLQVGVGAIGSTDITAAGLYGGGGTLNGTTLILNVNGAGATTLNLSGTGNAASESALIAAIKVQWPSLRIAAQGPGTSGKNIVLTAGTSLVIGAGTANTALGLPASPNAIEVDIPIRFPFPSGTPVDTFTPTTGLRLDFGGATLSGTGGRALWLVGNWYTLVENLVCNSSFSLFGPDFDEGGRGNTFRNCRAKYVANTNTGFAHEGGQDGLCDRCEAIGFPVGFQIGGISHEIRSCRALNGSIGLSFQHQGGADLLDGRYCVATGGEYDGNADTGVQLVDNSYGCRVVGVSASFNGVKGFAISTQQNVTQTTGASCNTLSGCVASGNGSWGFFVGFNGATLTHDGNKLDGCTAVGNRADGFMFYAGTTNLVASGCASKGNSGNGFTVYDSTCTGIVLNGCVSEGNGGNSGAAGDGLLVSGGDVTVRGFTSINDVSYGIQVANAGAVDASGLRFQGTATPAGWDAIYYESSADCHFSDATIEVTGAGAGGTSPYGSGILAQGSGQLWIDNIRCLTHMTTGVAALSGTVHIGPGCDFDQCDSAIYTAGSGKYTLAQTGGVTGVTTATGTYTLKFTEHYATTIEVTSALTGNLTIDVLPFLGSEFTIVNGTSGAFTVTVKSTTDGGSGVTVAQGKTAIVRVNSAGNVARVTADT